MKKLKVFQCSRAMSDFQNSDIIDSMTLSINTAIEKWALKEKIADYTIINSQLTSTNEFDMFGNSFVSTMVLSTHIAY